MLLDHAYSDIRVFLERRKELKESLRNAEALPPSAERDALIEKLKVDILWLKIYLNTRY